MYERKTSLEIGWSARQSSVVARSILSGAAAPLSRAKEHWRGGRQEAEEKSKGTGRIMARDRVRQRHGNYVDNAADCWFIMTS